MKKKRYELLVSMGRILTMMIGAILAAVGLEVFLIPNNIIDGGVTGISIMLSYLTDVQLGIFIFVLNMPFVIIGYRQIGNGSYDYPGYLACHHLWRSCSWRRSWSYYTKWRFLGWNGDCSYFIREKNSFFYW